MNNKRAKILRGKARQMTVGKPDVAYLEWSLPIFKILKDHSVLKTQPGVPCKLGNCTRKVYQQLKKAG